MCSLHHFHVLAIAMKEHMCRLNFKRKKVQGKPVTSKGSSVIPTPNRPPSSSSKQTQGKASTGPSSTIKAAHGTFAAWTTTEFINKPNLSPIPEHMAFNEESVLETSDSSSSEDDEVNSAQSSLNKHWWKEYLRTDSVIAPSTSTAVEEVKT